MNLSVRFQSGPEPGIAGNRYLCGQRFVSDLTYVVVLDGGVPVAQQSYFLRNGSWWVDDLYVEPRYRGTEVIRLLREATFRAVAEHTDVFHSVIQTKVASAERVMSDPIKQALGVRIELVKQMRTHAYYKYDVSALRVAEAV